MLDLVGQVSKSPRLGASVLPIFYDAAEHPRDGWTAATAIRGIEHVNGAAEGRRFRIPMFDHPDVEMACPSILTAPDAECVPALIATLARRPDPRVRIAILQAFTRLRHPATLEPMVSCLASPETRPYAIEALGYLGDARAIPFLDAWRGDTMQTWPQDDRGGPMMTVGDMAAYAISRIGFVGPPPVPRSSPARAGIGPTSIALGAGPSRAQIRSNLLSFVPLGAALFTLPWVFVIVILSLDSQGHLTTTPEKTRFFDAICAIPSLAGLAAGALLACIVRPLRIWQWIVLAIGCAGCGLAVFCFGWEFLH